MSVWVMTLPSRIGMSDDEEVKGDCSGRYRRVLEDEAVALEDGRVKMGVDEEVDDGDEGLVLVGKVGAGCGGGLAPNCGRGLGGVDGLPVDGAAADGRACSCSGVRPSDSFGSSSIRRVEDVARFSARRGFRDESSVSREEDAKEEA